jgi:hypothetical protein
MRITSRDFSSKRTTSAKWNCWLIVLLAGMMALSACGGGSGSASQIPLSLTGNWQFTMGGQLNSNPSMPSFTGGLQGGFLLQNGSSVTGQATFLIMTQPPFGTGGTPTQCNSGIEEITGTINGQTVNFTAQATGAQTFTLTGTLSYDGTTMAGSYTSTDGAGCGIAVTQNWSANYVPALTGTIQGVFHSTGGAAGLNEQDFVVTGNIVQGFDSGASSSSLTGNLSFEDPITFISDYPCFANATITGQISGNSVSLQLIASDGSTIGQIGQTIPLTAASPQVVTYNSTGTGYLVQSLAGTGYAVYAPGCGGGSLQNPADSGSVCFAVNSAKGCGPPVTISPAALSFPAQSVGSNPTTLQITVTNPSTSSLDGLTLTLTNGNSPGSFTETDDCGVGGAPSLGQPFSLLAEQVCTVMIGFAPQQSCPAGTAAGSCLTSDLTLTSSPTETILNVPITGGVSDGSAEASISSRSLISQGPER